MVLVNSGGLCRVRQWVLLPALMGLWSLSALEVVLCQKWVFPFRFRQDYRSVRAVNNNKHTLLWAFLCQLYLWVVFLGLLWKDVDLFLGYWLKSYNCCGIMRHGIYCQKNGVQEHKCWIFYLAGVLPTQEGFLTLQSFLRVGVLNVTCPCFPPLLQGGEGVNSYASPRKKIEAYALQMLLCTSGLFFCTMTEEGEKLWDAKGCHGSGSPFRCEVPPHFSPEVQTLKTLKYKRPNQSDWLCWGYLYLNAVGLGL